MSQSRHFEMLEFVRGIAAVYVLISHSLWLFFYSSFEHFYDLLSPFRWENFPYMLFYFRNQAVIVFFVISGYSVYHSLQSSYNKEPGRLTAVRKFYIRRFLRIYPTYLISLVVTLALFYLTVNAFRPDTDVSNAARRILDDKISLAHLLSIIYLKVVPFNYSLWSLRPEFYFYLLMPLLTFLFGKLKLWLAAIFLVIFLLDIGAYIQLDFFIFFLIGIATYHYRARLKSVPRTALAVVPLLVFFTAVGLHGLTEAGWPLKLLDLAAALCTCCIVISSMDAGSIRSWLMLPGKASYSIYLFHFPILYYFYALWPERYWLAVALTVSGCIFFYWLFERPVVNLKYKFK